MKSKKKALTPEEKLSQALLPREEWPYELPKGWVWTRLGATSEIIMGQSPSGDSITNDINDIPLIGGASDMGKLYPEVTRYTTAPTKLSKKNDLILCIRATLGRPIYSDGIYCLGRGVAAVRPQILLKEYLKYFIAESEQYLYQYATGTTFLQVNSKTLLNMPIPLPSIHEQQRIVNKIESLFAKLDEAGDRLQKVLDGYEARRAAILHEAFSGKWTGDHGAGDMSVPKGWRKAAIKDICHRLSYGTSKKSLAEGKYIVIRMGNLQNGTIEWSNLAYSNDETEYAKYKLHPGDVLFNRTNSSELVGKTSIYKGEYPAIYAGYLIKLDYDRALINGEYLNYYLNSPRAKLYYNQVKTDGVNQSNINSKKIGNFKIAFPSMEEQNNIVSKLNHIFENDKKSLFLAKESLSKIDLMKKSILARAFRGELGTQDSSDPSALELLKECVLAGKEVSKS